MAAKSLLASGAGGLAGGLLGAAGGLGGDTAGGAAVGWHSATGGFAVANHAAMGGLAVARDFAVGGQAIAAQSNTPAAQQAIETETLKWTVDWLIANQALFIAAIIVISIAPTLMSMAFYRRERVTTDELSSE